MSLARAFTTRRNQPAEIKISAPLFVGRAASQRAGRPVVRAQISSPVALVSTSNALLNNAEAIAGTTPIANRTVSSGSSASSISGNDSDASTSRSLHSADSTTDASSIDEQSPTSAEPDYNHLSCYFKPAVDTHMRSSTTNSSPTNSARPSLDTPRVPSRVPSHSKKAHESLHRKRSIQRMMSPPPTSRRARESTDMFSPTKLAFDPVMDTPKENPFGKELAQLDEVVEEFGHAINDAAADADIVYMQSHGLAKYQAVDYMSEINQLVFETYLSDESDASSDSGEETEMGGWI